MEEKTEIEKAMDDIRGQLDVPGYRVITSAHEETEGAAKLPDEIRGSLLSHVNAWRAELKWFIGREKYQSALRLTQSIADHLALLKDPKDGFGHVCETEAMSQWLAVLHANLQFVLEGRGQP